MVILAKERFGNGCVGIIYFPSLSGGVELNLIDPIVEDLNDIDLSGFNRSMFAININPVVKITSSLDTFPFYSTPEPRYKLGSYAIIFGYDITVNEDETFISVPYLHEPKYLVYPLQRLEEFRMGVKYPDPNIFDYRIVMEDATETFPTAEILDARKFAQGFMRSKVGTGIVLNLTEGVTADIRFYYTCVVTSVQNTFTGNVLAYLS